MAIFHMHAQVIGRGSGRSSVAASAYRSGTCLTEVIVDRDRGISAQVEHDYRGKKGIAFSSIMGPSIAPSFAHDRELLWNKIQNEFEIRKDAQFCREIDIALPSELSLEENKELLVEFVYNTYVLEGMIADVNMHYDNPDNPHAHIMLTTREIIEDASREGDYTFGLKVRYWNSNEFLVQSRRMFAGYTNKHLALAGIDQEISHLSHKDRGIDLTPTIKEGIGRYVKGSDRAQINREIQAYNISRTKSDPTLILDQFSKNKIVFTKEDIASSLFDLYEKDSSNCGNTKERGQNIQNMQDNLVLDNASNKDHESTRSSVSSFISALETVMSSDKLILLEGRSLEGKKLYTLKARYDLETDFESRLMSIKHKAKVDRETLASAPTPHTTLSHSLNISHEDLDKQNIFEKMEAGAKLLATEYLGSSFKDVRLSVDQKNVAFSVLNDRSQVTVIEGLPGSGKTTLMREIARQYKNHGYKILGAAVSNSAARELSISAHLSNSMNITQIRYKLESIFSDVSGVTSGSGYDKFKDKLNLKLDYYKDDTQSRDSLRNNSFLNSKTVLVVDEASMVDLTEMHYIIREVERSGSKLILLGDRNQLPAIGTTGAFEKISEIFTPNSLHEVKRQENPLHLDATKHLSNFKIANAINAYRQTNSFVFAETTLLAKDKLIADYVSEYQRVWRDSASPSSLLQEKLIALSYTNEDISYLNTQIREKLIDKGIVGCENEIYEVNKGGIRSDICLSKGDQIVFNKNNHRLGISNSDIGEVIGFGSSVHKTGNQTYKTLIVKVPNIVDKASISSLISPTYRVIEINNHSYKEFDHGYAKSIYKSQGKTYDKVFGLIDKHTGYHMFNVMATRHKIDLKLYAGNDLLQEPLYAKMSKDVLEAKLNYEITPAKEDKDSYKYAGLISLIQRRGDTSLALGKTYTSAKDSADRDASTLAALSTNLNTKSKEEVLISYIDTRNEAIKLRQLVDRWLAIETAKGRVCHYNDHPYIKELNDLVLTRQILAAHIIDNDTQYFNLLAGAKINYSTIEKHADKNEYKYYFNKREYNGHISNIDGIKEIVMINKALSCYSSCYSENEINLIKNYQSENQSITDTDLYGIHAAEIKHHQRNLAKIAGNLLTDIEEHKLSIIKLENHYLKAVESKSKAIDKIEDASYYITHTITDHLSIIYKDDPRQVLANYEKLKSKELKEEFRGEFTENSDSHKKESQLKILLHKIQNNPELLGNIKGVSILGISVTSERVTAAQNTRYLASKLLKYEEYKQLTHTLKEKLDSGEFDKHIQDKEVALKSLSTTLPGNTMRNYIKSAYLAAKDPDITSVLSWSNDSLTSTISESYYKILEQEGELSNQATATTYQNYRGVRQAQKTQQNYHNINDPGINDPSKTLSLENVDFIQRVLEDQLLDVKTSNNITFTPGDILRLEIDRTKLAQIILHERSKDNASKHQEVGRNEILNAQTIYNTREKEIKSALQGNTISEAFSKDNPLAARIFAENLVDSRHNGSQILFEGTKNIERQKLLAIATAEILQKQDLTHNHGDSLYKNKKIFSKAIIQDNNIARGEYIKFKANQINNSNSALDHLKTELKPQLELHKTKAIIEHEVQKTDHKIYNLNKEYKIHRQNEIRDDKIRLMNRENLK